MITIPSSFWHAYARCCQGNHSAVPVGTYMTQRMWHVRANRTCHNHVPGCALYFNTRWTQVSPRKTSVVILQHDEENGGVPDQSGHNPKSGGLRHFISWATKLLVFLAILGSAFGVYHGVFYGPEKEQTPASSTNEGLTTPTPNPAPAGLAISPGPRVPRCQLRYSWKKRSRPKIATSITLT